MNFITGNLIYRPLFLRATSLRCICCIVKNVKLSTAAVRHDVKLRNAITSNVSHFRVVSFHYKSNNVLGGRYFTQTSDKDCKESAPPPKLGIVARFKEMYRDYWYVLIPVHIVTSTFWYGSFYFISKGGVDIVQMLTWMGFSESVTAPLQSSSAGYFAIAYALYKVATPLRYTVTIGGTTFAINYLRNRGYLKPKPIPSTDQIKEMYKDRRQELADKTNQMREKKDNIKEDFKRYQSKISGIKNDDVKSK